LQEKIDALGAWDVEPRVEMATDALRCPPGDQLVDKLSGGERRRVGLPRLLLQKPAILLLDEPTNHLDAESVHWLEQNLARYAGTVIAVTHDRYFLGRVARHILALEGDSSVQWFNGNHTAYLEDFRRRKGREAEQPIASSIGSWPADNKGLARQPLAGMGERKKAIHR